jgi:hypothetical protein
MVSFENEKYLISASSIDATFGDGATLSLDTITVTSSTPMGDEIVLSSTDDDDNRVIRLILTSPDQDWRHNQDYYAWKLDNAWMTDQEYKWLHWNVESFINSEIQVPTNNSVFACESMEFHFSPIGMRHSHFGTEEPTKVVLLDVKIGASLSFSTDEKKIFRPCSDDTCSLVDGTITGDGGIFGGGGGNSISINLEANVATVALGSSLLIALIWVLICWILKRRRTKLYQEINPTAEEEDLQLSEEESPYQKSMPVQTDNEDEDKTD